MRLQIHKSHTFKHKILAMLRTNTQKNFTRATPGNGWKMAIPWDTQVHLLEPLQENHGNCMVGVVQVNVLEWVKEKETCIHLPEWLRYTVKKKKSKISAIPHKKMYTTELHKFYNRIKNLCINALNLKEIWNKFCAIPHEY